MRLGLYSRSSSFSSRTDLISTACKDTILSQRMHGKEQLSLATTRSHAQGASAWRPLQRQQPPILHSGILAVSCCISSSSRRYFICTPCTYRGASQLMHDSAAHMAALLRVHAIAALESVPFAIGSLQILSSSCSSLHRPGHRLYGQCVHDSSHTKSIRCCIRIHKESLLWQHVDEDAATCA